MNIGGILNRENKSRKLKYLKKYEREATRNFWLIICYAFSLPLGSAAPGADELPDVLYVLSVSKNWC